MAAGSEDESQTWRVQVVPRQRGSASSSTVSRTEVLFFFSLFLWVRAWIQTRRLEMLQCQLDRIDWTKALPLCLVCRVSCVVLPSAEMVVCLSTRGLRQPALIKRKMKGPHFNLVPGSVAVDTFDAVCPCPWAYHCAGQSVSKSRVF